MTRRRRRCTTHSGDWGERRGKDAPLIVFAHPQPVVAQSCGHLGAFVDDLHRSNNLGHTGGAVVLDVDRLLLQADYA